MKQIYRVHVDFTPAYELVTSLAVYLDHKQHKFIELPKEWVKRVKTGLKPDLTARLAGRDGFHLWPRVCLLIWQCPDQG